MSMPDTVNNQSSVDRRNEILVTRRREKLKHDLMNNLNGSMINGQQINEANIQDALQNYDTQDASRPYQEVYDSVHT